MGDAAIWIAVLIGGFGTFMWRALGVAVETRVQEDSPLFNWIGCVAYAMVAGLMARWRHVPSATHLAGNRFSDCPGGLVS